MKSPLELMIDQACGVTKLPEKRPFCIIKCPVCKSHQRYLHQKSDPNNATLVICKCPDCEVDDEEYKVKFFDKNGDELAL